MIKKIKKIFFLILIFFSSFSFSTLAETTIISGNDDIPMPVSSIDEMQEQQKQLCLETGGSWEPMPSPDELPKPDFDINLPELPEPPEGMEIPTIDEIEMYYCVCPDGMQSIMGSCFEENTDILYNTSQIGQSTCEAGEGKWICMDNVILFTEKYLSEGNHINETEELCSCNCGMGYYWSKSQNKCLQESEERLCKMTGGSWSGTNCTCNFPDTVWKENQGCMLDFNIEEKFPDTITSEFKESIGNLYQDDVVDGFSDGLYHPFEEVTRAQMAKFIVLAFDIPINTSCEGFNDVPSNNEFYDYIMTLKCSGIISGYQDGTYKPDEPVTRGMTAKYIIKAMEYKGIKINENIKENFLDVNSEDTFASCIAALAYLEISTGYSDQTFKPEINLKRGEMAKLIDKAKNYIDIE